MWLPEVRTSTCMKRSWPISSVMPLPPAAFSPLATIMAGACFLMSPGRNLSMARRPGRPTMSPRKRIPNSAGIFDRSHLPNDGDLDLAGVIELVLDLRGRLLGQERGPVVGDLLGLDDDADLPAGLQGEGLLDAFERRGDLLELLQPLDVRLEELAPGPGPGGRERVGGLDEDGLDRREVDVAGVGGAGLADLLRLALLLGQLA